MSASEGGGAIVAFAKAPVPGGVKTRLTSLLTPEEAAAVYAALLQDTLAALATLGTPLRVYAPPSDPPFPEAVLPPGASLHEQRGGGLGERMFHALAETFLAGFGRAEAFLAGFGRAVVVGTDHPTLPPAFVRLALEELAEPFRLVLGPSADGGYYLIGMNELQPGLFRGAEYGHARVFEEALERAAAAGVPVSVLPEWADVDTPEDLRRLARELEGLPGEAAPRTREVLAKLRSSHPDLSTFPHPF